MKNGAMAAAVMAMVMAMIGIAAKPQAARGAQAAVNPLEGGQAKQIYGAEFDLAKGKGRVVFFEYWGINCGPCRASYPHLVAMQKKYGPTGRFVLVTSHAQGFDDTVVPFLKKSGVNFPVYQQLMPTAAVIQGYIPMAFLFDHTGKLVGSGAPGTLYGKVEALVKAAPMPLPDSPMIEGVDVQACRAQAMAMVPGRAVAEVLKALEARVKGAKADAAEAQALLDKARAWITAETERLEPLVTEKPAEVLEPVRVLAATTAGMTEGKKPAEFLATLQKDPNVAVLARIVQGQAMLAKVATEDQNPEYRRRVAMLKGQLEAFRKRTDVSPALTAEAAALPDAPGPAAQAGRP
ncbi:MAG: TlpA disulfide reductase family protein [Planctomycetota bacterium]|nr:TlpA disulfide reductase family protein [Planctomycetota bacterium]